MIARPGQAAPGHIRLAFGVFLALGVMLSGWPMLAHLQQRLALDARATILLNRPLEAEIAGLLRRAGRFSTQVRGYHDALETAEAHLWAFKNNRESSLILKDVGNDDGELGLRALRAAYPAFTVNLTRLNLALSQAEQNWRALRVQTSPGRLREVDRGLSDVARAARTQEDLLRRYQEIAKETGKTVVQFNRLAPQVVGRVPDVVSQLPGQLRQLRAAMTGLEEALDTFSREPPEAGPRP